MTRKLPRHQAAVAFAEEFREFGAFDLASLDLARLHINNVQLEYRLRQVQTNYGQIQSRLHGGLQDQWLQERPLWHFAT